MAHRIEDISGIISAGIVVYRRMQETVQTQYGMLHPPSPEEEDHVPLHKYYGKNTDQAPRRTMSCSTSILVRMVGQWSTEDVTLF